MRIRRATSSRRNERHCYETLETRNLLASTLYVDFGFGFQSSGGLTISNTQSATLGGPAVFGTGTQVTTFAQDILSRSSLTTPAEIQAAVASVMAEVQRLMKPFAVNVVQANSTSVAEIGTILSSTATQDAYIYVGGNTTDGNGDFGVALLDSGNTTDNLAFVSTDLLSSGLIGLTREVAHGVARQGAITYGVHTTEQSILVSEPDVMSVRGTDSSGNRIGSSFFPSYELNRHFLRPGVMRTLVNGVSPGNQSSYDAMVNSVGASADGVAYFTTTGGDDLMEIQFSGPAEISFTISNSFVNETWNNVDVSAGIEILFAGRTHGNNDRLVLGEKAFSIIADGNEILVDGTTTVQFDAGKTQNLTMALDDFADQVVVHGLAFYLQLETSGGNDMITLTTNTGRVNSGTGDDRFIFLKGNRGEYNSGAFDHRLNGGEGNDVLDFSQVDSAIYLPLWSVDSTGFTFGFSAIDSFLGYMNYGAFEDVIEPAVHEIYLERGWAECINIIHNMTCTPPPVPVDSQFVVTVVDGDQVTVRADSVGKTLVLNGAIAEAFGTELYLLSTSRDIRVGGNYVQVSSSLDLSTGSTDTIGHNVVYVPSRNFNAPNGRLVIGNMAGSGREINWFSSNDAITGLFNGTLIWNRANLEVHGSDTEADSFLIRSGYLFRYHSVKFFGHGGDDYFVFGSKVEEANGDLGGFFIDGDFQVEGGSGNDIFYLNDEGSVNLYDNGKYGYTLSDSSVTSYQIEGPAHKKRTRTIVISGLETVRLTANSALNRFYVDPSPNTKFVVEGGNPGMGDGDSLKLFGESSPNRVYISRSGQGNGTWWFQNIATDNRIVVFDGIETIAELDRLAVSSQPGESPLVQVFNAQSGLHLFDIIPFPTRFRGGIQTATADLTGDGIEDIIVAPGPGRWSLIQIFDGVDGKRLGSFHAFPANQSDPAKNFYGGSDVAVANVAGDSGFEIITSTFTGTQSVRTYRVVSMNDFQLLNGFNALPGSSSVGVRLATGDFDGDGYHDIVSAPGPGGSPQIAIHKLSAAFPASPPIQLARFLGNVADYRGGFNVAVGNIDRYGIPELILSPASSTGFAGKIRVMNGNIMGPNKESTYVAPEYSIPVFSASARGVSVAVIDNDRDGYPDWLFASVSEGGTEAERREIRKLSALPGNATIDTVFADGNLFETGISLG